MKKLILIFPVSILLLLFSGCSDEFLDKGLRGELEVNNFLQSESDLILATNGAYNVLRSWRYHGGFPILDILSDEARKGSNPTDGIQILEFDEFSFNAENPSISGLYLTLYDGIKRCNLVINGATDIDMDENLKTRLVAEARFLRGITYFQFVRVYGGIPIVTTLNPERKLPRNTAEEVYRLVVEDLLFAADNLPERSEYSAANLGRATKGAAKGMLAKVYLFQGDFQNAEKYALEVINSGEYSLDPDFGRVFSKEGEYGPGSIFEIGALGDGFGDGGHQYANTQGVRGVPNRGWGFNRPSWELITFFKENNDPRMDATIIFLGEVLDGVLIIGDSSTPDTTYTDESETEIDQIECYNQKVWVPGTLPIQSFDHNVRMLRYADVLLMAAEALNENNKPGDALMYLNMVRERARGGNPNILPDITVTDKNELRQLIWEERHAELAMEQNRYLDLIRTGQAATVLGPLGFQANKHELFPIPQSEIDLSEGVLAQNPGY